MGNVANHLLSVLPHQIALPSVVLYELQVGIAKSNLPEKRRKNWTSCSLLCVCYRLQSMKRLLLPKLRTTLEQAGTLIGPLDMRIAGIVLVDFPDDAIAYLVYAYIVSYT
jgi:tRNA(fMet)-specific endonuclease VapC